MLLISLIDFQQAGMAQCCYDNSVPIPQAVGIVGKETWRSHVCSRSGLESVRLCTSIHTGAVQRAQNFFNVAQTYLRQDMVPSIFVHLSHTHAITLPHAASWLGSAVGVSRTKCRNGRVRKPQSALTEMRMGMLVKLWAVMPSSCVTSAPSSSAVLKLALHTLMSAAYRVASTPWRHQPWCIWMMGATGWLAGGPLPFARA